MESLANGEAAESYVLAPHRQLRTAACPTFLGAAIGRMIDPGPMARFKTLGEAVTAIAHRDLDVEVARDSFRRILGEAQTERGFFRAFYSRFLSKAREIKDIFEGHHFPVPGPSTAAGSRPSGR